MKQAIWSQNYNINTFMVTPQKRLGLYGLLNLIQDSAWIHATHLGHGYEEMMKDHTAWILTRQKLEMDKWPRWGDDLKVITWIRPITNIIAIRDFEFHLNGQKIGRCSTQWLILDLRTRKPAEKLLALTPDEFRQDYTCGIDAGKISIHNSLSELAEFHVRNSDLDLNGHVNNTKYAQWILDSVSYEKHLDYTLKEYEVNFIAETKSGDHIKIFSGKTSDDRFQFQGLRSGDNKIVFTAATTVIAGQLPPSSNLS